MPLSRDADYAMYLYTCNRCRSCAVEPGPEMRPVCPSYSLRGYFSYSGGGKGYVAQGILEGKVPPSREAAQVAMDCLMCGACVQACPPGFDINAFIRDLRDHLVGRGFFLNDRHRAVVENLRHKGNPWGRKPREIEAPPFTGEEDLLVWRGCRERDRNEILPSVKKILEAAGVSWGVLEEPCCGAPLFDLGDKDGFEEAAGKTLSLIEESGAQRVLILCPHCAQAMVADYIEIGDLAADPVTLPSLILELMDEGRIEPASDASSVVTVHDPCRLARGLEEGQVISDALSALPGIEVVEMENSGEWTWCCGAGGWMADIVPELTSYAAGVRVEQARRTGAEKIVTACGYCVKMLGARSGKKQQVVHLADLAAGMIGGRE